MSEKMVSEKMVSEKRDEEMNVGETVYEEMIEQEG